MVRGENLPAADRGGTRSSSFFKKKKKNWEWKKKYLETRKKRGLEILDSLESKIFFF